MHIGSVQRFARFLFQQERWKDSGEVVKSEDRERPGALTPSATVAKPHCDNVRGVYLLEKKSGPTLC